MTTMGEHTTKAFDVDLQDLSRLVAEMGGMAEQMVSDSIHALVTSDAALAQRVISEDTIMDATEREIGDKAILMIAKRQPVASDLREIMGSIRIASDLERVGDLGKSNAKRVIAVQTAGIPRPLARGIEHLSELALSQLKDVLAHVHRGTALREVGAVFSTRGDDFVLTVGGDLAAGYRLHDREAVHLFCAETIAPQMTTPEAVCLLEG